MFKSKRDNLRHIYSNICNALFHIFVSVTFSMCEFHCVSAWSRFEKIFQTMGTRFFFLQPSISNSYHITGSLQTLNELFCILLNKQLQI